MSKTPPTYFWTSDAILYNNEDEIGLSARTGSVVGSMDKGSHADGQRVLDRVLRSHRRAQSQRAAL